MIENERKEKLKLLKILLYLLCVASMIFIMINFYKLMPDSRFELVAESAVITVVTLFFLYLISGKKTFRSFFNETGYVIKTLWPVLAFPLIFMVMGIISLAADKLPVKQDWQMTLILDFLCMMLAGVYEEGCFRCCACDAMLPVLKKSRHPFLWTSLIAGLIFGWVHVITVDFSDFQQLMQFILKITNLALASASYMFVYWKTRNLFGMALIHGFNDFLPTFLDDIFAFEGMDQTEGYISGNSDTTVIYLIQFCFELAVFIYVYRKVWKRIDRQKVLEEW